MKPGTGMPLLLAMTSAILLTTPHIAMGVETPFTPFKDGYATLSSGWFGTTKTLSVKSGESKAWINHAIAGGAMQGLQGGRLAVYIKDVKRPGKLNVFLAKSLGLPENNVRLTQLQALETTPIGSLAITNEHLEEVLSISLSQAFLLGVKSGNFDGFILEGDEGLEVEIGALEGSRGAILYLDYAVAPAGDSTNASVTVSAVADQLYSKYATQLKGADGTSGLPGPPGKGLEINLSGTSAEREKATPANGTVWLDSDANPGILWVRSTDQWVKMGPISAAESLDKIPGKLSATQLPEAYKAPLASKADSVTGAQAQEIKSQAATLASHTTTLSTHSADITDLKTKVTSGSGGGTPSAHEHVVGDVKGLVDSLSKKAVSSSVYTKTEADNRYRRQGVKLDTSDVSGLFRNLGQKADVASVFSKSEADLRYHRKGVQKYLSIDPMQFFVNEENIQPSGRYSVNPEFWIVNPWRGSPAIRNISRAYSGYAPVNLPHGSRITSFTAAVSDQAAENMLVLLVKRRHAAKDSTEYISNWNISILNTVNTNNSLYFENQTATVAENCGGNPYCDIVDNSTYKYFIYLVLPYNETSAEKLAFNGAVIGYQE